MDSTGEIFNRGGFFTTIFVRKILLFLSSLLNFFVIISFFSLRKYIRFLKFYILSFMCCIMLLYMGTICASNRLVCRKVSLQNKLSDTVSNYLVEFATHSSKGRRYLQGHVSSKSPKIPGGRYVTWKESWKNLEKWRHYPSKVN